MQRNVEPSAIFFQEFNSVIRSFTGSSRQCYCFEAPTALTLWVPGLPPFLQNCNPITHQAIELESYRNHQRIQQVF